MKSWEGLFLERIYGKNILQYMISSCVCHTKKTTPAHTNMESPLKPLAANEMINSLTDKIIGQDVERDSTKEESREHGEAQHENQWLR